MNLKRFLNGRTPALAFLSFFLPIIMIASPAFAAAFSATAYVTPQVMYLNDITGTVLTFTINNTGTVDSIGAVQIERPSNQWSVLNCPTGPLGWTRQTSSTMCRYRSANGTADDIMPGQSNSAFQLRATTTSGNADRPGVWKVTVSKSNQFDNPSLLSAASATPPGLTVTAHSWQILDAVVVTSAPAPGSACPTGTKQAIAGSTQTIVICGRNRTNSNLTPTAAFASLGGTFIASAGTFSSGVIAKNSSSSRVLGTWTNVVITSSAGTGKTIVAKVGSAANQTSPSTTLGGYEAKNQPPTAGNDSYSVNEDTTLNVAAPGVLNNDSDPDGDPITAVLATGPAHGTLTLNADGSFTYTPAADYNGPDSFTYKAQDSFGAQSAAATVSITVDPVNDAPVANNNSYATNEDTLLSVAAPGVLGNDNDVDGDALTAALVTGPANGSLTLNADGSFSYTPDADYNGPDSFTYKANDGALDSNVATVSITVNAVNDAPTANNDGPYDLNEDTTLVVTNPGGVLGNDTDPEGDPLTAVLVSGPSHAASFTLNANGTFTYEPVANYNGPDSFTYKANDGTLDSNVATATLNVQSVNDAPEASGQSVSTDEDTPIAITLSASDVDGDALTFSIATTPANGALGAVGAVTCAANTCSADVTYTPSGNFNGPDSFTFTASDGSLASAPATVSITVNPVNDAPTANNDSYANSGGGTLNVPAPGVLGNDTDVENDALTAVLVSGPTQATSFTLNADGSFSYTPQSGAGVDSFTYKANDGSADSNVATVTISNNQAPTATGQSVSTNEDTAEAITLSGSDPEDAALSFTIVTGPAHGGLGPISAPDCSAANVCTANVTYTPDANYNGPDSFTFKVNDGTSDSNIATVSITVDPVNDAPTAGNDGYSTNEDTALNVPAPGVLANDSDVDLDPLTAVLVTGPVNAASFTLNADGSFSYTPATNFNGSDSFTYKANDGTADSNVATVTITVNPINDAPVASGQSVSTNEDTLKVITLSASDADQDTLAFSIVDSPTNGALGSIGSPTCAAGTCTASVTYTPNADYNGPDSFTFKVNDGSTDSNTATVSITVDPVNDAPALANIEAAALTFTEGDAATNVTSALTVNDVDNANLASATVTISAGYQNGADTLAFTPVGGITGSFNAGTGALNLSGSSSLANYQTALRSVTFANNSENPSTAARTVSFVVNDGAANSNTATRNITVIAVDDAPVNTVPGGQTVNEDTDLVFSTANGNALSVADVDAGSGNVQVTVSALNGTITPATGSGATVGGSGTSSATMTGTLTQVNAALNGLKYKGNANYNSTRGAETLTILSDDQGNTGQGGPLTDTDTVAITVNAVNDAPSATAKNFTAQANMKITGLSGLLTGATDPDTGDGGYTAVFTVGTFGATSPAGGTISNVDANAGTFDFDPPPGATGNVTFTYTVCDNGNPAPSACSAPATITVNVSGPVIWFVNPAAASNGDGRLSSPFNVMSGADGVDAAGHRIFVYAGTAANGIALNTDEWLIGQGVSGSSFDSVMGITPPAGTIARPTIGGTRPTLQGTVTLNGNAVMKGLNLSTGASTGLADPAASISGVTVAEVSATSTTGTAVSLSNTGGSISLTAVTSNGGTNGIVLSSTTGSFTVTGTGSAGSGGAIQNKATGISLTSAASVSLSHMQLNDFTDFAIRGTSVNGFTLANSVVSGTSGNDDVANEGAVIFDNLTGVASITNSTFSGSVEDTLRVLNNTGSLNRLTISGSTFGLNHTSTGGDGVLIESSGTAVVNVTAQNNFFTGSRADHFQMSVQTCTTCSGDLIFTGNTMSNNHPNIVPGGGTFVIGGIDGTFTFNVDTNTIRDATGTAMQFSCGGVGSTCRGTANNNTIGVAGVANSGSTGGGGMTFFSAGGGLFYGKITNNTVYQYNNHAILVQAGDQMGNALDFQMTVTGNTASNPGNINTDFNGIHLNHGTVSTDNFSSCVDIKTNNMTNGGQGSTSPNNNDIRLRQRQATTVRLPGYGGANNDNTAVQNFIAGQNSVTAGSVAASNTVPTGGGYVGGAACAQP